MRQEPLTDTRYFEQSRCFLAHLTRWYAISRVMVALWFGLPYGEQHESVFHSVEHHVPFAS
jgi:hypothetical protein